MMGGNQVPGGGSGDDGYDEDGYDESQRAEILEATRDGPSDGTILTDLEPDTGEEEDESEGDSLDDLEMSDDEIGAETEDEGDTDDDDAEDDVQDDFDNGTADKGELKDGDAAALKP